MAERNGNYIGLAYDSIVAGGGFAVYRFSHSRGGSDPKDHVPSTGGRPSIPRSDSSGNGRGNYTLPLEQIESD